MRKQELVGVVTLPARSGVKRVNPVAHASTVILGACARVIIARGKLLTNRAQNYRGKTRLWA